MGGGAGKKKKKGMAKWGQKPALPNLDLDDGGGGSSSNNNNNNNNGLTDDEHGNNTDGGGTTDDGGSSSEDERAQREADKARRLAGLFPTEGGDGGVTPQEVEDEKLSSKMKKLVPFNAYKNDFARHMIFERRDRIDKIKTWAWYVGERASRENETEERSEDYYCWLSVLLSIL